MSIPTSNDAESAASPGSPTADSRSVRRSIRSVAVGLALLAVCIALGTAVAIGTVGAAGLGSSSGTVATGATSDPGVVVSDVSLTADAEATETHRVALTDAPAGLAGFKLTLELESTDVATVAGADYPDHFGMTTDPSVGANERTITVEAVDLDDEITAGATDVTLARIDVVGVDAGETELRVADLQVDADGGDAVEPSLEPGTVTVAESGTASGSGSDADGSTALSQGDGGSDDASDGDSDDGSDGGLVESLPGFTAGLTIVAIVAIAAIAALAAALLARRD